MAHSLISNCWWSDGCTGSVGRGMDACFFVVIFEFFHLILGSFYISFDSTPHALFTLVKFIFS